VTALAKKVPTITVTGKGNYSGTALSEDFTIEKQDLGNLNITVADKVYQNKKNIYKTTVTITDLDGKKLSAGSDYDKNMVYTYSNQTELADGTIKAAGAEVTANDIIPANTMITVTVKYLEKGSYVGEISGEYRIIPADIKGAKTTVDPQIYTGKEIELTEEDITVTMKGYTLSPDEFEIVDGSYKNHVKKGTASVTIKATSENYGGTKSVSFKIVSKSIFW
jgi:hypothetical protein